MPKLHGAKVLSGLGRAGPFTRNAMLPRSPRPQRRESRVGRCLYKIADSRHGFWVSAIDLSGRVGWELRSCFCGQCIGLQKSDSIRPKQISLKGCFWKKTARVFPYENCSHNQHDTSVYGVHIQQLPVNPCFRFQMKFISWKGFWFASVFCWAI